MGTEATAFIKCINGRDPQINELWCLGLDGICRKVHTKARVEVPSGTVGEFGIKIIGQLSVNNSVQFLGLSD